MLGEAYFKLDRLKEAEHWYREALRAKADHIPAHLTYGKLLTKMVSLIMRTVTLIGTWGRKKSEGSLASFKMYQNFQIRYHLLLGTDCL